MIIGGSEVFVNEIGIVGFVVLIVLLMIEDLLKVFKLFDVDCNGFVLGEGGVVMVFESFEYVKVCGVKIFGEIVGYGVMGDVYYIILLDFMGKGVVWVM